MEVDLFYEAKIPLWSLSQFLHNTWNQKAFAIMKNYEMAKTK